MTGETFITDEGRQKINDKFAPFTVDMETASIAHVYNVNRIPFISIRCITDTDACRGMCNFEVLHQSLKGCKEYYSGFIKRT